MSRRDAAGAAGAQPPTYLHEEFDLGVPVVPVSRRRVRHAVGARGQRPGPGRRHLCGARASAVRSCSSPGGGPLLSRAVAVFSPLISFSGRGQRGLRIGVPGDHMERGETGRGQGGKRKRWVRGWQQVPEQQVLGCKEVSQDPRLSAIPRSPPTAQNSRRPRGGVSPRGAGGAPRRARAAPRPTGCPGKGKGGKGRGGEGRDETRRP